MRVIAVSDIHNHITSIDLLKAQLSWADVVILSGDITHFGHRRDAEPIIEIIQKSKKTILAVSGNCDHPDVEDFLNERGIGIHGQCRVLDGVVFVGSGGSLPAPVGTPNEKTEKEIANLLEDGIKDAPADLPLILVSHQPPYNTKADRIFNGSHVGSRSVRSFITQYRPVICFTGHIHEGIGVDTLGNTVVVNPGPLNGFHVVRADLSTNPPEVEVISLKMK